MTDESETVPHLAERIGANAKTMRTWMRKQNWRHPVENRTHWHLPPAQVTELTKRFGTSPS